MAFNPFEVTSKYDVIYPIEACAADMQIEMNEKFLLLNDDKTEFLIATTRGQFSKISDISIKVGDQSISSSDYPSRNLGVAFNFTCCSDGHVV